jgi:oxygen-independent coproporphyrinogen-3 oxidase
VAREELDRSTRTLERILLEVRIQDGLPVSVLTGDAAASASALVEDGLIDAEVLAAGRVVLTLRGRLLADLVVRRLTPR